MTDAEEAAVLVTQRVLLGDALRYVESLRGRDMSPDLILDMLLLHWRTVPLSSLLAIVDAKLNEGMAGDGI